jgi:hypothetical protein
MARVKKIDTSKLPSREDSKRLPGLPVEILIPSGRCPAKLTEVTRPAIKKWIDQIDEHVEPWETMNESAYCYWLRDNLNIFSADFALASLYVKEICEKREKKRLKQAEQLLKEQEQES